MIKDEINGDCSLLGLINLRDMTIEYLHEVKRMSEEQHLDMSADVNTCNICISLLDNAIQGGKEQ